MHGRMKSLAQQYKWVQSVQRKSYSPSSELRIEKKVIQNIPQSRPIGVKNYRDGITPSVTESRYKNENSTQYFILSVNIRKQLEIDIYM